MTMATQWAARMCRTAVATGAALAICAVLPGGALAQQCPPNAHQTGTSLNGNIRTIHCECDDGYVKKRGKCGFSSAHFGLQHVSGQGTFYLQLKDGRRLTGQQAQQVPIESTVLAVTGPNSSMVITLPDDSTLKLGPNSKIQLDSFIYEPNPSAGKVSATIIEGLFRYITARVARKDRKLEQFDFGAGGAGLRGTEFESFIGEDGSGQLKLFSGQLKITPANGTPAFLLVAGQMISFTADKAIKGPTRFK